MRRPSSWIGFTLIGFTLIGFAVLSHAQVAASSDVYVVDLDGRSGKVRLPATRATARFPGATFTPAWSLDGKWLLYSSFPTGNPANPAASSRRLYLVSLKGEEADVPSHFSSIAGYCWTSDNEILVNGTAEDGREGLFKINPTTGNPLFVAEIDRSVGFPVLSPDDRTLFYRSDSTRAILARDLRTGAERILFQARAPFLIRGVRVSRDGRRIAFVQTDSPTKPTRTSVHVMSVEGDDSREILRLAAPEWVVFRPGQGIEWTSDGNALLVIRSRPPDLAGKSETHELLLVPLDGGKPHITDLAMEGLGWPVLHPGGSKLAFFNFIEAVR